MDYKNSILFKNLSQEEITMILDREDVFFYNYRKDESIFYQGDRPKELYILISGGVVVEKIDINGKRTIVNIFREAGTVFGEVYLYLSKRNYDYQCRALEDTKLLAIEKDFFHYIYSDENTYSAKVIENMLEILSNKAFYLNQKLLILGSFTLKQKISNYLLMKLKESNEINLDFNRQDLADYIGTTRPSLSRELMKMEDEKLIKVEKDRIVLMDIEKLEEIS